MVRRENRNIMKFRKRREGLFSDFSKDECSLKNIQKNTFDYLFPYLELNYNQKVMYATPLQKKNLFPGLNMQKLNLSSKVA